MHCSTLLQHSEINKTIVVLIKARPYRGGGGGRGGRSHCILYLEFEQRKLKTLFHVDD